jgi:3-hydroxyisobutyrate dehydrogenase-like beta-hydroxyacid dehydrogenase
MAELFLAGGDELTIYNRAREKALPLAEQGARVALEV